MYEVSMYVCVCMFNVRYLSRALSIDVVGSGENRITFFTVP